METFEQILELDDDDADRTFSKSIVQGFFEQFTSTYAEMKSVLPPNKPVTETKLKEALGLLSSRGHFLKGSSAALGVRKVQATCEIIQNTGNIRSTASEKDMNDALKLMDNLSSDVLKEFNEAKEWFESHGYADPETA